MAKSNKTESMLNKAVKALASRIESTEKFVLKQAPDLCKEMVRREMISSLFFIAGSLALLAISMYFFLDAYQQPIMEHSFGEVKRSFENGFSVMVTFIMSIVSFVFFVIAFHELVVTMFCPKLVIIKSFKQLLTTNDSEE